MERQILPVARHNFAITLQALLHRCSIAAFVLDEAFGSDIDDVIAGSLAKLRVPAEQTDRLGAIEVLYGLVDGGWALLRSQCRLARLAERVTIEATQHFLQVGDERARVTSQSVCQLENLPV